MRILTVVYIRGHRSKVKRKLGEENERRAEKCRMLSAVHLSSVPSCRQREVRGLVVMVVVVMAVGLGNKQKQGIAVHPVQ